MSEERKAIALDHKVELRIPSQCGICKKELPEDARQAVLKETASLFVS